MLFQTRQQFYPWYGYRKPLCCDGAFILAVDTPIGKMFKSRSFSIQNFGAVEVSFLVWSVSLSKVILILGMYLLGMLTGWGVVELVKRYFAE